MSESERAVKDYNDICAVLYRDPNGIVAMLLETQMKTLRSVLVKAHKLEEKDYSSLCVFPMLGVKDLSFVQDTNPFDLDASPDELPLFGHSYDFRDSKSPSVVETRYGGFLQKLPPANDRFEPYWKSDTLPDHL